MKNKPKSLQELDSFVLHEGNLQESINNSTILKDYTLQLLNYLQNLIDLQETVAKSTLQATRKTLNICMAINQNLLDRISDDNIKTQADSNMQNEEVQFLQEQLQDLLSASCLTIDNTLQKLHFLQKKADKHKGCYYINKNWLNHKSSVANGKRILQIIEDINVSINGLLEVGKNQCINLWLTELGKNQQTEKPEHVKMLWNTKLKSRASFLLIIEFMMMHKKLRLDVISLFHPSGQSFYNNYIASNIQFKSKVLIYHKQPLIFALPGKKVVFPKQLKFNPSMIVLQKVSLANLENHYLIGITAHRSRVFKKFLIPDFVFSFREGQAEFCHKGQKSMFFWHFINNPEIYKFYFQQRNLASIQVRTRIHPQDLPYEHQQKTQTHHKPQYLFRKGDNSQFTSQEITLEKYEKIVSVKRQVNIFNLLKKDGPQNQEWDSECETPVNQLNSVVKKKGRPGVYSIQFIVVNMDSIEDNTFGKTIEKLQGQNIQTKIDRNKEWITKFNNKIAFKKLKEETILARPQFERNVWY